MEKVCREGRKEGRMRGRLMMDVGAEVEEVKKERRIEKERQVGVDVERRKKHQSYVNQGSHAWRG